MRPRVSHAATNLGLVILLSLTSHSRTSAQAAPTAQPPRVTLEEIGIKASHGLSDADRFLAALTRPLDATFVGDHVIVLDAAAPWIRVYDRQGRFLNATVGFGENPGETRRPFSISTTGDGQVMLAHHLGLEWLDADGRITRSLPLLDPAKHASQQPTRPLGVIEACGGQLILHAERRTTNQPSAAAIRIDRNGALIDTLAAFAETRLDNRMYIPWHAVPSNDGVLLYTEENRINRLLEVGCDGRVIREIPLDSLGPGKLLTPGTRNGPTGFTIRNFGPPYAAGLVRMNDRVLWATRVLRPQSGRTDTLTVVTSYEPNGISRRIEITGWIELFDVAPDGSLLVGNSWQHAQRWDIADTWGVAPAVFQLDGNALLRIIEERGQVLRPPLPLDPQVRGG